jgi:MFS family permease
MIGAIGSMFFIGWAAFSMFIPYRADKVGRKNIILVSFIVTTIATFVILISSSIYILLTCSLIMGTMAPGRVTVAYVYMMESLTPEWRTFVASLSSLLFVICFTLVTAYLDFIA